MPFFGCPYSKALPLMAEDDQCALALVGKDVTDGV